MSKEQLNNTIEENLPSFYEGKVFKNFKVICRILKTDYSSKNTKKHIENQLSRWVEFETGPGNKVTIVKIREYQAPDIDGNFNKSGDLKLCAKIILKELVKHPNGSIIDFKPKEISPLLGICSEIYIKENNIKYKNAESDIVSYQIVSYIKRRTGEILDSLGERGFINHRKVTIIYFGQNSKREATEEEIKKIKEEKDNLKQLFKIKNEFQLIFNKQLKSDFYSELKTRLGFNSYECHRLEVSERTRLINADIELFIKECPNEEVNKIIYNKELDDIKKRIKHEYLDKLRIAKENAMSFEEFLNYFEEGIFVNEDHVERSINRNIELLSKYLYLGEDSQARQALIRTA